MGRQVDRSTKAAWHMRLECSNHGYNWISTRGTYGRAAGRPNLSSAAVALPSGAAMLAKTGCLCQVCKVRSRLPYIFLMRMPTLPRVWFCSTYS